MALDRLLTLASDSYRSTSGAVREIEIGGRVHRIDGSASLRDRSTKSTVFQNGIPDWTAIAFADRTDISQPLKAGV